jgi:flagellar biosynthesis/type III secretory pathway chaperone
VSQAHGQDFGTLLCEALDAQLEQHARLAAIAEAQTSALSTRDVESVDALTRALESAMLEGPALEQRRAGAAAGLAQALGVTGAAATLSALTQHAPATLAGHLADRADRLDRSVERLRRASAVNRVLIEGELATIDRVMHAARRTERSSYSAKGDYDERLRALLDARA